MPNLFSDVPDDLSKEVIETLAQGKNIRIERIVSHGQARPGGFWYDHTRDASSYSRGLVASESQIMSSDLGTNPSLKRSSNILVVQGDLLDQKVDVIVNAWNRNFIPWWLLLPKGVSGAIRKRGGTQPFKEVAKHGPIPLGQAVLTSAGNLPFKGIIHVAGISMFLRASEKSIRDSVRNAERLAHQNGFKTIAFPLIGAGVGSIEAKKSKQIMLDELRKLDSPMIVTVVEFNKAT